MVYWTKKLEQLKEQKTMDSKKWYHSRAIWSAIIKSTAGILTSLALVLSGELSFVDFLPGLITSVWSVYDIIIRYDTGEPIVGSKLYYRMRAKI